jgi:hypothetical protein
LVLAWSDGLLRGAFLRARLRFGLRFAIRGSTLALGDWKITVPQLGLAIAGPLTIFMSALADRETKPVELLIFTAVLTAACIACFGSCCVCQFRSCLSAGAHSEVAR